MNNNYNTFEEFEVINNSPKSDIENVYFNCALIKKIIVQSKYLNENINEYIETLLKNKVEGLCISEGYVKPNSVRILKRSVGMLLGSRFTGDITFEVVYTADVCNPVIGNIIICTVRNKNKLGILAKNGPITIIVGKQLYKNNDFEGINVGDNIKVEVIVKKFSLNDKEIQLVGRLWDGNENSNEKILFKNNKKEDLISSDLTPIMYDNDGNNGINGINSINEQDNIMEDFEEEEEDEDISIEDEDNDLVDSDEEPEQVIKIENPDENNLDADDIEFDEDDIEDDIDDNDSVIDYE
jgi:DNA-directed RNA polymerase subunit E'/Rpb7